MKRIGGVREKNPQIGANREPNSPETNSMEGADVTVLDGGGGDCFPIASRAVASALRNSY
jgi:hypothetical protein